MVNRMKVKGDVFERAVRDYAREHGYPHAEKTKAGYERDAGDIHLRDPLSMTVGVTVQCKNVKSPTFNKWVDDMEKQRQEAKADYSLLVWKRQGVADPGEQFALMPLKHMLEVLRLAGYGEPLNVGE